MANMDRLSICSSFLSIGRGVEGVVACFAVLFLLFCC